MKNIKEIATMLSPFNNLDEMPAGVYVIKKLLAFFVIFMVFPKNFSDFLIKKHPVSIYKCKKKCYHISWCRRLYLEAWQKKLIYKFFGGKNGKN